MRKLSVNIQNKSYDIIIRNDFTDMLSYIKEVYKNKKIFIITDDNVYNLHYGNLYNILKDDYIVDYVVIPHGEGSKNLDTYKYICEELIKKNIRRNELIIGFGGGVVGDIAAFVSSTIYRGVNFINIPTTLLSMVDSSIGGKTGIDFCGMKNILGTFYQPKLVLINLAYLKTLDEEEIKSGMGELIKHGMIGDPSLLEDLINEEKIDEDIVHSSLLVKKNVVEVDPYDQKERMFLNFGHTFGHVIELKYNLKHGIAVAVGMLMAIKMGIDLELTDSSCYHVLESTLVKYGFDTKLYDYHEYLEDIKKDKKNLAGKINFVLIKDVGKPFLYTVSENEIEDFLWM